MAKAFVHRIHVRRLRLAVGESRSAWALARRLSVGCTRPLWWWWHCVAKPCPGGLPAGRRQSHRCGQVWRRWRPRRRDHCGLPRRRPHRRAREGVLHSRRTTEVPPKAAPPKLADMKSCRRERVSVAGIAIRLIETDGTHVACPRGAPSFRCAAAVARARRSLPWNAIQYRPWLLRHICCLTRTVCAPQCQELSSVACCPSRSYRALRRLRAC